jgi:hypothetical protein
MNRKCIYFAAAFLSASFGMSHASQQLVKSMGGLDIDSNTAKTSANTINFDDCDDLVKSKITLVLQQNNNNLRMTVGLEYAGSDLTWLTQFKADLKNFAENYETVKGTLRAQKTVAIVPQDAINMDNFQKYLLGSWFGYGSSVDVESDFQEFRRRVDNNSAPIARCQFSQNPLLYAFMYYIVQEKAKPVTLKSTERAYNNLQFKFLPFKENVDDKTGGAKVDFAFAEKDRVSTSGVYISKSRKDSLEGALSWGATNEYVTYRFDNVSKIEQNKYLIETTMLLAEGDFYNQRKTEKLVHTAKFILEVMQN